MESFGVSNTSTSQHHLLAIEPLFDHLVTHLPHALTRLFQTSPAEETRPETAPETWVHGASSMASLHMAEEHVVFTPAHWKWKRPPILQGKSSSNFQQATFIHVPLPCWSVKVPNPFPFAQLQPLHQFTQCFLV